MSSGRLFLESEVGLHRELGKALGEATIFEVGKETATVLFSQEGPQKCTAETCLLVLATRPTLGQGASRVELLRRLLPTIDTLEQDLVFPPLRYLLHGRADHYLDAESLWGLSSGESDQLWRRLVEGNLENLGEKWRVISFTLAEHLTDGWKTKLKVSSPDPRSFEALSRRVGPDTVSFKGFSSEQLRTIYLAIGDIGLLADLPLHMERRGDMVPIEKPTYLLQDIPLPPEVLDTARVILLHPDEQCRQRQIQLPGIIPIDAIGGLQLLLQQSSPSKHPSLILDMLYHADTRERSTNRWTEILHMLKTTAWLVALDGSSWKPEDLVSIPELEERVARILRETEDCPYLSVLDADGLLQKHDAFSSFILLCTPSPEDSIALLAMTLSLRTDLALGTLREPRFEDLRQAFEGLPEDLLPGWQIVERLGSHPRYQDQREELLEALRGPIDSGRMVLILDALSKVHESDRDPERKQCRRRIHDLYLKMLSRDPMFSEQLPFIRLLNLQGSWHPPTELTWDCPQVNSRHPLQQNALKP
jgi:hypothetical protein